MTQSLFSYVVTHDLGFAPNPFGQVLTLACCKPVIRRVATIGDWVLGYHSARVGQNLVCFVGKVDEALSFDSYFRDTRYSSKHPAPDNTGDAIYFRDETGALRQVRNRFHGLRHMAHDIATDRVLICREFWYFGSRPQSLPPDLYAETRAGRGHRRLTNSEVIWKLQDWLVSQPAGVHAAPRNVAALLTS